MSTSRLYFQNYCTQASFGGFSVAGGAVANAVSGWSPYYPYKVGRVLLETQGTYTGNFDANYMIEVTQATTGNFATARWRWSDTGGPPWDAENLTPVTGAWVALNNGLEVRWVDTTATVGTPQFVVGDYYLARALRPYGIVRALDGSRNSEYRTGALPTSSTLRIGWDFGSAVSPGLLVVDDHNFPSNATITLRGDASTLFDASPDLNQAVTWRADRLRELVTAGPYRYWWLNVVMGGTALTYGRMSGFFLGPGVTMTRAPTIGFPTPRQWLASLDSNIASRGAHPRIYDSTEVQFAWQLVKDTASEDGGRLEAAWDYAQQHASYTSPPLWFLLYDDDLTSLNLYSWSGSGLGKQHRFLDKFDYQTTLVEVIRTVSS